MKFVILPFAHYPPEENMEIDAELARKSLLDKKFILRWYGWRGLALSLGYSQCKEVEKFPFPLKKICRPTGGGILLHGWDISFALTTPVGFFDNFLKLYRFVALTFVETFQAIGIEGVNYSRNKKGNYKSLLFCWAVPTFGEVTFKNKKLVSAAVREFKKENFLIHGSVYIKLNEKFLKTKLLNYGEQMLKTVATLNEIKVKKSLLMEKFTQKLEEKLKKL